MKFEYEVHSVSESDVPVTAKVNGKDVDAKVAGLTVELVSKDGNMSHTFRIIDDVETAKALYTVGATITSIHSAPGADE